MNYSSVRCGPFIERSTLIHLSQSQIIDHLDTRMSECFDQSCALVNTDFRMHSIHSCAPLHPSEARTGRRHRTGDTFLARLSPPSGLREEPAPGKVVRCPLCSLGRGRSTQETPPAARRRPRRRPRPGRANRCLGQ